MKHERDLSFEALAKPYGQDYDFFAGIENHRPCEGDPAVYDPVTAWALAEAAFLAYRRDPDYMRVALGRVGLDEVTVLHGKGAQGYFARGERFAWLVFRGTEPDDLHDILADLRFTLGSCEEQVGLVHQGFELALDSVWDEVAPLLADCGVPWWLAGHSLGAALALLSGRRHGGAEAVYTFGAPRVGTRGFRNTYPCPVFRVANNNDLVTMVPPPLLYRHVGKTRFIDHEGHVGEETTAFKRAESRLLGHVDHAGKVLRQWRDGNFNAIPNQNMTDHAPINYAKLLRRAVVAPDE